MFQDPTYCFHVGGRINLRPVEATMEDGMLLSRWRNSPQARAAFHNTDVVTPESHIAYVQAKSPYSLVWIVELGYDKPIGTCSLDIDPHARTGEHGRVWVDPHFTGQGYATEMDYTVMAVAFEFFELAKVWAEPLVENETVIRIHQKCGYRVVGIDVPGHTHPRGPIAYIEYYRQTWAIQRELFYASLGVEAGAWQA